MKLTLLLVFLFLVLSVCVWTFLRLTVQGYGRYQAEFTETAEDNFDQLFLFFDSRKIFVLNVLLLLTLPLLVYLMFRAIIYVVLVVVLILVLPRVLFKVLEARRRAKITMGLPDALAQMAGSMKAGATMLSAMETMVEESSGPISQEFALLLREQRMGVTLDQALENLAERVQTEEMDLLVTAAQISRELGGNLSDIFERLSKSLRQKIEMESKIRALTSQGKLQGIVVGLLPFFLVFALVFIEPEATRPIFTSLLGWMFLCAIVVMELLGALMIRKIVTIDV